MSQRWRLRAEVVEDGDDVGLIVLSFRLRWCLCFLSASRGRQAPVKFQGGAGDEEPAEPLLEMKTRERPDTGERHVGLALSLIHI